MTAGVLRIGDRRVGPGEPVYVVAEMSANHHQSLEEAVAVVRAAAAAGADAIKVQTYTPDTLTLDDASAPFRIEGGTPWDGRRLYDLYAEAYLPWEWHAPLREAARASGLDFFSTPFDATAVEALEALDVAVYKIASFEIVDLGLIRRVAETGKPIILSTGMATWDEIAEALATARDAGCPAIALLKCTSAYPAPPEAMNLRTLPYLAERFGVPVGLSDHTLGVTVPIAAVTLGACIVEKHFTRSRAVPGPDSAFSLEPAEFAEMVAAIRTVEQALGEVRDGAMPHEATSVVFRRSLFVVRDVAAGQALTAADVRSIRPGTGLAPRHLDSVLGRHARRDLPRGTPLSWDHLA